MDILGNLQESLSHWVEFFRLILEWVSVLCIVCGLIGAIRSVIVGIRFRSFPFLEVRLRFGSCLALALEFQLGSDILTTTIAPSFDALGKLAIIAVIRTFLNYFLTRELQEEQALKERQRSFNI
ncbi:MAG: DUF1622 domain-containing protein [Crocosphaera sp.]